jgi:GntR family transcriptional repressor for pyruvate dehydrogenase complex
MPDSGLRRKKLPIRNISRARAFEEVLDQLDGAIATGHLEVGDRLPPERDLAEEFGVSRTSVREAIRTLEALGILEVRRGSDNGATIVPEPGNALSRLLRLHLGVRHVSVRDLIGFRVGLEGWAAAQFALRRDRSILAELEGVVEQMSGVPQAQFSTVDTTFHSLLMQGSENGVAVIVHQGAQGAISRTLSDALMDVEDWPREQAQLIEEHRGIAAAVRQGNGDAATARVERSLRRFWDDDLGRTLPTS